MTGPVTVDQLRNLTDRAGHGLTPEEQARFRTGLDQLHAELEHARAEADRWAEAESADIAAGSYAGRVEELEAALARQAQETATWRATANALDAGGPGTPRTRAEQAEQQRDQLAALVRDFLDPDRCRLDHHGYCQAHSWMCGGSRCPHARAREVLAELDGGQQADAGPEPEDLTGAYMPDPPIGCLTPAAVPDGTSVIGPPPGISADEARQMRDDLLAVRRPTAPAGLRDRLVGLHAFWVRSGPPPLGASISRWWDRRLAEFGTALGEQPGTHVYLSTGCLHGDHTYCQSMTGLNGSKRPGECKHCQAKCTCSCHQTKEN